MIFDGKKEKQNRIELVTRPGRRRSRHHHWRRRQPTTRTGFPYPVPEGLENKIHCFWTYLMSWQLSPFPQEFRITRLHNKKRPKWHCCWLMLKISAIMSGKAELVCRKERPPCLDAMISPIFLMEHLLGKVPHSSQHPLHRNALLIRLQSERITYIMTTRLMPRQTAKIYNALISNYLFLKLWVIVRQDSLMW